MRVVRPLAFFVYLCPMKRLIIFDLDGTLLNSIADLAEAVNRALLACGFPQHPTDAYRFFVGDGVSKLFERALPEEERTPENVARIRAHFMPYYDKHNADLSRPYEGIMEMLEALTERGMMMAVASNKYQAATEKLVAHYFGSERFVVILGQREGIAIKPSPEIIEQVLSVANVSREEVLFVGDSNVDMQTGRNAKVDTVGVSWGFRPREELAAHNPMAIINHPLELLALCE